MCSVRQANNVLLWTNFVRQKDSVLMLNIHFETLNFVQFSWGAGFFFVFFFHGGIFTNLQSLLHTSSSLSLKILKMFGPFFCFMMYSLSFLLLWSVYCGFTFNTFIHIVYKIQGLNLLVILGTSVISFAALAGFGLLTQTKRVLYSMR